MHGQWITGLVSGAVSETFDAETRHLPPTWIPEPTGSNCRYRADACGILRASCDRGRDSEQTAGTMRHFLGIPALRCVGRRGELCIPLTFS